MNHGRIILTVAHLLVALVIAACATRLQTREIERRETPWCVGMTDKWGHYGYLCVQSRERCDRLVAAAQRYGSLAGLVQIDECVYEEVQR